jgi:hypothetical protein
MRLLVRLELSQRYCHQHNVHEWSTSNYPARFCVGRKSIEAVAGSTFDCLVFVLGLHIGLYGFMLVPYGNSLSRR